MHSHTHTNLYSSENLDHFANQRLWWSRDTSKVQVVSRVLFLSMTTMEGAGCVSINRIPR